MYFTYTEKEVTYCCWNCDIQGGTKVTSLKFALCLQREVASPPPCIWVMCFSVYSEYLELMLYIWKLRVEVSETEDRASCLRVFVVLFSFSIVVPLLQFWFKLRHGSVFQYISVHYLLIALYHCMHYNQRGCKSVDLSKLGTKTQAKSLYWLFLSSGIWCCTTGNPVPTFRNNVVSPYSRAELSKYKGRDTQNFD